MGGERSRLQRDLLQASRGEGHPFQRQSRAEVAKQDWYQTGYLANIVTYTVAKIAD